MASKYQWDPSIARFRDPDTGRYIRRARVREALDTIITRSQARVTSASDALRAGTIDLAAWQTAMRTEIKRTHLAAEALVRGGWTQMTPADYGRVGSRVKAQYQYLYNFTEQLRSGEQRTDGTFMNRARMYMSSARVGFHDELGTLLQSLGYAEERNILHPAEHCLECLDMASLKWVPTGTLVPVGLRECRGNDRCSIIYR